MAGKLLEPGMRVPSRAELAGAHLINAGRTWVRFGIGDAYKPDPGTMTPKGKLGKFYPNGLWIVKVWGQRSDGCECHVTLNVDGRWFTDPARFWPHLQKAFVQLETFRDCECTGPNKALGLPGKMCALHGLDPVAIAKMTVGGKDINELKTETPDEAQASNPAHAPAVDPVVPVETPAGGADRAADS